MPNGYGFGFRGASAPWPYIGRGRGGLPRCWYPGLYMAPTYWPGATYPSYSGAWAPPFYGGYPTPGPVAYAPQMSKEEEVEFLRDQAQVMGKQLEDIQKRLQELEKSGE